MRLPSQHAPLVAAAASEHVTRLPCLFALLLCDDGPASKSPRSPPSLPSPASPPPLSLSLPPSLSLSVFLSLCPFAPLCLSRSVPTLVRGVRACLWCLWSLRALLVRSRFVLFQSLSSPCPGSSRPLCVPRHPGACLDQTAGREREREKERERRKTQGRKVRGRREREFVRKQVHNGGSWARSGDRRCFTLV